MPDDPSTASPWIEWLEMALLEGQGQENRACHSRKRLSDAVPWKARMLHVGNQETLN